MDEKQQELERLKAEQMAEGGQEMIVQLKSALFGGNVETIAVRTGEPDPHPEIITAEERQTQEEVRKQMVKDAAEFHDRMLMMALTGVDPLQEEARQADLPQLPEPVGAQKIIELPEPKVSPMPEQRWNRRCDSQQPKARHKTNREKRRAAAQRKAARRK